MNLPDAKGAPIAVNLKYVKLPAPDPTAQADENAPDPLADIDPKSIPALDIAVDQLFQGSDLIGAWSLRIRPTAKGLAFNNLDLGLKGMLLKGAGGWEGAPGASSSWYKGRLDGRNIADVLKGLGLCAYGDQRRLSSGRGWPLAGFAGLGRAQALFRQPGCCVP